MLLSRWPHCPSPGALNVNVLRRSTRQVELTARFPSPRCPCQHAPAAVPEASLVNQGTPSASFARPDRRPRHTHSTQLSESLSRWVLLGRPSCSCTHNNPSTSDYHQRTARGFTIPSRSRSALRFPDTRARGGPGHRPPAQTPSWADALGAPRVSRKARTRRAER
ncbi:hypothetical protein BC628DRAFT_1370593 [Trametes gibbosa]|nr:hypothetical protein BC628DRAFT_1370593 [Trametes gibbosa]